MIARLIRTPAGLVFAILGLLIILMATFLMVPETRQGVVVRFGEPVRIVNAYKPGSSFGDAGAGLYVKMPFAEQVEWIDKRILSLDMDEQEVLSTDQLRLQVDAYARYRVVDPLTMYRTARSVTKLEEALRPLLGSAIRNELGKQTFGSLLAPERGTMMVNVRNSLNALAKQYGADVIDVRIIRAELPKGAALDSTFERMRTSRAQEAATKRAEGYKQAQIIRAEADAQAAQIYAASFGKDPDFYDFYRAMQAYRQTFVTTDPKYPKAQTNLILSPGNEFLREFRGN